MWPFSESVKDVRIVTDAESKMLAMQEQIKAMQQTQTNLLDQAVFQSYVKGGITYLPENAQTYVYQGYMANSTIYSIINKILEKVKIAPLEVLEQKPDQKSAARQYKALKYSAKDQHQFEKNGFKKKGLQDVDSGTLYDLIKQPNPAMNTSEFVEACAGFYNICGEVFIYGLGPVDGPNKGLFTELYVMPSHLVEVVQGTWQEPVIGYKLLLGNQTITFPKENILHIKRWNPYWDLNGAQMRGQSPLRAGIKNMSINNMANDSRGNAYVNGGVAGVVSPRNPADIWNPTQTVAVKDKITNTLMGTENTQKVVAFAQSVDFTQVGMSPVDLQILAGIKEDKTTLCALWGVDFVLIDSSGVAYENKEKAQKGLVVDVVMPFYNNLEQKLMNWLVPAYSKADKKQYVLDFDTSVFPELKPDQVALKSVFGDLMGLTLNQRLEIFGIEPNSDPQCDKVYLPNNYVLIDDIANPVDSQIDDEDEYDGTAAA